MQKGSNVNAISKNNNTLLHEAVYHADVFTAEYLIKHHANVNVQNDNGQTPLHVAVSSCFKRTTELLIEAGADTTLKTKDGETFLDLLEKAHEKNITILRKNEKYALENIEGDSYTPFSFFDRGNSEWEKQNKIRQEYLEYRHDVDNTYNEIKSALSRSLNRKVI